MPRLKAPSLLGQIGDWEKPVVPPGFKAPKDRNDSSFEKLWSERSSLEGRLGIGKPEHGGSAVQKAMDLEVTSDNYNDLKRWVEMGGYGGGKRKTTEVYTGGVSPKDNIAVFRTPSAAASRSLAPTGRDSGQAFSDTLAMANGVGNRGDSYDPYAQQNAVDRLNQGGRAGTETRLVSDTRMWASTDERDMDSLDLLSSKLKTFEMKQETAKLQYKAKMTEEFMNLKNGLNRQEDVRTVNTNRRGTKHLNTSNSEGGLGIPQ